MARDYHELGRDDAPTRAERGEIPCCQSKHPTHGQCVNFYGHDSVLGALHTYRVEEYQPAPEQAAADSDAHQDDYLLIGKTALPTSFERGEADRCDSRHAEYGLCVRRAGHHRHTRHAFRVEEYQATPEQATADEDTPATEVDAPTPTIVLGPAYPLTDAEQGEEPRCEASLEPYGRCALVKGHDEPTEPVAAGGLTLPGTRHAYRGEEPPMHTVEHDSPSTLAEQGQVDRCNVEHELYGQCIKDYAHFDLQHTYRLPAGVVAAKIGGVTYGAHRIDSVSYGRLVAEMEQDTPESPELGVRTWYVPADKHTRTAAEEEEESRCIVATDKYGRCILYAGHDHGRVDEYGHTYRVAPGQAGQAKPAQYELEDVTIMRADGKVAAEFKVAPEGISDIGGLMPDTASNASLKRSLALVEAWLDDDEQLPLPHTGFGADLYHALRDILRAAQS